MSLEFLPTAPLFHDMPFWAIGCIVTAYFFGFFVRGAFGFGSNIPIVLVTTSILGPHHAIVLAAVATGMVQIDLLPQGVRTADWQVSNRSLWGCSLARPLGPGC